VELLRRVGRVVGFRSAVIAPMLHDGEAVGAILVARPEPGRFSETDVKLLQTFADQAVIAIENVRLFKELEARNADLTEPLEHQTATAEILRVISAATTDVQPVFQAIARDATRLSSALMGSVYRFDGELIHMVAHHDSPAAALEFSHRSFPAPLSRHS